MFAVVFVVALAAFTISAFTGGGAVEEVRRPGGRRSYEIHAWHGDRLVKETMTSALPSA